MVGTTALLRTTTTEHKLKRAGQKLADHPEKIGQLQRQLTNMGIGKFSDYQMSPGDIADFPKSFTKQKPNDRILRRKASKTANS